MDSTVLCIYSSTYCSLCSHRVHAPMCSLSIAGPLPGATLPTMGPSCHILASSIHQDRHISFDTCQMRTKGFMLVLDQVGLVGYSQRAKIWPGLMQIHLPYWKFNLNLGFGPLLETEDPVGARKDWMCTVEGLGHVTFCLLDWNP